MDVEDLLPDRQKPVIPQRLTSSLTTERRTPGSPERLTPATTQECRPLMSSSTLLGRTLSPATSWSSSRTLPSSPSQRCPPQCSQVTQTPSLMTLRQEGARDIRINMEMDPFIKKTLEGIKKVAPNLRYRPKHHQRKKFKVIPYKFASIWRSTPTIFSKVEPSPMESLLPSVSWEKVNPGALKRLPVPTKFPVHSVSLTTLTLATS